MARLKKIFCGEQPVWEDGRIWTALDGTKWMGNMDSRQQWVLETRVGKSRGLISYTRQQSAKKTR